MKSSNIVIAEWSGCRHPRHSAVVYYLLICFHWVCMELVLWYHLQLLMELCCPPDCYLIVIVSLEDACWEPYPRACWRWSPLALGCYSTDQDELLHAACVASFSIVNSVVIAMNQLLTSCSKTNRRKIMGL